MPKATLRHQSTTERFLEDSKVLLSESNSVKEAVGSDYYYKWSAATPVFISAQTGYGKNNFIETVIIPQMVPLGCSILILSNRIALGRQEKKRIAKIMDDISPKEAYSYTREVEKRINAPEILDEMEDFGEVTIKSYQSFLGRQEQLKTEYDFIIFDECHFFLSDANFNKYTYRILVNILNRFSTSIRIYMTATPYEAIIPILEVEKERHHLDNTRYYEPIFLRNKGFGINATWNHGEYNEYTLLNYSLPEDQCPPLETIISEDGRKDRYYIYDTYNAYSSVIYELKRDYQYINCKYLKSLIEDESLNNAMKVYHPLIDLIKKQIQEENNDNQKSEKWLIFVPNKELGKFLHENIGEQNADFIHANSKSNSAYLDICRDNRFSKKVLISTSVLDNGVNINDNQVKHIAIFTFDKVAFLQMLGRKRIRKNEKITLYIQEYDSKLFKFLASWKSKLARLEKNNQDIIKEIFDNDEIFFCESKQEIKIDYNHFLKRKLLNNISFINKFSSKPRESGNQVIYEQYINNLNGKENFSKKFDNNDLGQKTIIEQLSWMGIENSFDPKNFLESYDLKLQKNIEEFLIFLDKTAIEEITAQDKSSQDFYRKKGMNKKTQAEFCEKFTTLYNNAYGKYKDTKSDTIYGKNIIDKCLTSQQLPYALIIKSVKILASEKQIKYSDRQSETWWILKKSAI